VEQDVEQAYYMSRMEPAIRSYLNRMRDEAFIQIRQGFTDTGATYAELHSSIAFSAYVPPAPKKKAKVERTRFRESTHSFRQKSGAVTEDTTPAKGKKAKKNKKDEQGTEKPGKREKIRYGQAPRETLPTAANNSSTEDAGALPEQNSAEQNSAEQNSAEQNSAENLPTNPLEPQAPTTKTRFSERARTKAQKKHGASSKAFEPAAPDAAEVSDREMQSAPLGLNGATAQKKKRASQRTAEKTRMSQQKKQQNGAPVQQPTPIPPVAGAPAPGQAAQQPQQ
jgi:peptidyl-prolyl cis-trans isomerase SurA